MEFEIKAGGKINAATPTEVRDIVQSHWQQYWEERARGIKHLRFIAQGTVAGGAVLINDAAFKMGPEQGFVWAVQRINVENTVATDTLYVYRDPAPISGAGSQTGTLYGSFDSTRPLHIGSKGIILHGGERLAVFGSGLTTAAGTQVIVNGECIEAPAFKLRDIL